MKNPHKKFVRAFIMELLYDQDVRLRLDSFSDSVKQLFGEDLDSFEAMEFYEQEVERINKMFYYPPSLDVTPADEYQEGYKISTSY